MHPSERENNHMEVDQHPDKFNIPTSRICWKEQELSAGHIEKLAVRPECVHPSPRAHHCSILFKNKIYIWGGNILELEPNANSLFLYAYELESKKWKKMWTKTNHKDLEALQGQCHALINNRWYFYGGVNKLGVYSPHLWKLNLESLQWAKCEQKGELPNPTEGGHIIAFQKNWLLHYEGFNSRISQITHSIFVYSIDTKTWYRFEGNYEHSLKFRLGTSICLQNSRVFMFGGAYQTGQNLEYLSDMHELKINFPTKLNKILEARVISKRTPVPARSEHSLMPFGKDYLCLIGGHNSQRYFSDIWIYNLKNQRWTQEGSSQFLSQQRIGYSCIMGSDEIFFFGGYRQSDDKVEVMSDLWGLQAEWRKTFSLQEDYDITEASYSHSCSICFQKRNKFIYASKPFSSQSIKDFKQSLEFPFAAFGLLLDNSLILGATEIMLQFQTDSSSMYYIKIQDNGKCMWEQEEYFSSILSFCSQNQMILLGCDKKVKKSITKSNLVKEYGVNLKLGCLRLGKKSLIISFTGEIIRVCLIYEENTSEDSDERQFLMRYFSWNQTTKQLVDPDMRTNQQYIEIEYRKYIRQVLNNKVSKNIVYIFDTIIDDQDEELKCRKDLSDIYFGDVDELELLQRKGYHISDSIDISLKAYISSLYLKNQYLTIQMEFGSNNSVINLPINLQSSLEQIDRLARSGYAVELDGLVEFDFKFAEFYFLRDIKPNQRFFNNGILLYYKNRLICRHRPALGEMVPYLLNQQTFNNLPIFGFAQLPQNVPLNASKTAFTFIIMVEKMFSRLKFVEESFKSRSSKLLGVTQLPHPKPKNEDQDQQDANYRPKKYIIQQNQQRIKKRFQERYDQLRKKSKKEIDKVEFTPYPYKSRETDQQMRKTRKQENIYHSESNPNPPILIQHEDSSIKQINQKHNASK